MRWRDGAVYRDLRRREHLIFGVVRLPESVGHGVLWPYGDGTAAVMISDQADQIERKCATGEEVTHSEDEFSVVDLTDVPDLIRDAIVGRAETRVKREVARRFVPPDDLAQLIASIIDDGRPVEVWEIAAAFEVTDVVAQRAMEELQRVGFRR